MTGTIFEMCAVAVALSVTSVIVAGSLFFVMCLIMVLFNKDAD